MSKEIIETTMVEETKEELKEAPKKESKIKKIGNWLWSHKWGIAGSLLTAAGVGATGYKIGYGRGKQSCSIGYEPAEISNDIPGQEYTD